MVIKKIKKKKKKKKPLQHTFQASLVREGLFARLGPGKVNKTPLSCVSSEGGGMGMVSKGREEPLLRLAFQVREGCGGGSWKVRPSHLVMYNKSS